MASNKSEQSELYVCSTIYHLLIASIKVLLRITPKADIAILDTMPQANVLCDRLRDLSSLNDVFIYRIRHFEEEWHPFELCFFKMFFFRSSFRSYFHLLDDYDEIYLFNDKDICGWYCSITKRKYHLLEDGLDCYKLFDQYQVKGHFIILRKLAAFFMRFPISYGWSSQCIDVEVNDAENMKTKLRHPIKVCPRKQLFDQLPQKTIDQLINVFNGKPLAAVQGAVLVLTQPLKELGLVHCDEEQRAFYSKLGHSLAGNQPFFIKPHPRDTCDYSKIVPSGYLISQFMPAELLNYSGSSFKIGVTYSSTSLNALSCVKRKLFCDKSVVYPGAEYYPISIP